jgi:hypothetical protein
MYPSINQNYNPSKTKRIKPILITLVVLFVFLLFSFPTLHMLDTKRRLNNVRLPLSNQLVAMGSNGLGPSDTNISFTVNKSYTSSTEAKNDIIERLEDAGISILKPSDRPSSITLKYNGTKDKALPINEIATTFFPNHYAFTFYLERQIPCEPDTNSTNDGYLCNGEVRNDALENKLINNQPVRSVNVQAAVKFFH